MLRRILFVCVGLLLVLPLFGCGNGQNNGNQTAKTELLIYCGITMVKPMGEIADAFEAQHNCKVILNQGGSEDLYQSLKHSGKGDLYLPGSHSYRENHLEEGLLGDFVYLGFNQAAFLVPKGNPRQITGEFKWLVDPNLSVVIGNPESCSIGKASKKILVKAGVYDAVVTNCFTLAADSRNLNKLIREGATDLMMNWRATAFFDENRQFVDVVDLPPEISPRKKLLLNVLNFSTNPELAHTFMEYASSPAGLEVFHRYGFLTDEELKASVTER